LTRHPLTRNSILEHEEKYKTTTKRNGHVKKQAINKTRKGQDDKSRSGNALREDDDETLRANPQSHGSDLFSVKGPEMLGDNTKTLREV
jgi:hypothetical protein